MTGRGFTGHEHLDGFGLIHMNARLYDPILGRFLSPDPYVQLPDFTQAMNRYGYCMNRPLCYVDKNGEVIGWIIAGAIIGGAINVATHWDNISNFGQFLGYFGVGAAAGALGPLVGGAVGGAGFIGGAISGMVGGAASGFTLGTGNTLMAGGGFLNALGNGTMGAFSGAMCGGALGGVFGGGIAIAKGQNFWHGNAIAQGRGMFSWKNTPVGETGALSSVPEVMPDAMPKMPKPDTPLASAPQPENGTITEYTITTTEKAPTHIIENNKSLTRSLKIKGYHPRIDIQKDLYHNFPYLFDNQIVNKGYIIGIKGNSLMMVTPGTINGVQGVYTLGINTETGIVYHRAFYELSNFTKQFKF